MTWRGRSLPVWVNLALKKARRSGVGAGRNLGSGQLTGDLVGPAFDLGPVAEVTLFEQLAAGWHQAHEPRSEAEPIGVQDTAEDAVVARSHSFDQPLGFFGEKRPRVCRVPWRRSARSRAARS